MTEEYDYRDAVADGARLLRDEDHLWMTDRTKLADLLEKLGELVEGYHKALHKPTDKIAARGFEPMDPPHKSVPGGQHAAKLDDWRAGLYSEIDDVINKVDDDESPVHMLAMVLHRFIEGPPA